MKLRFMLLLPVVLSIVQNRVCAKARGCFYFWRAKDW